MKEIRCMSIDLRVDVDAAKSPHACSAACTCIDAVVADALCHAIATFGVREVYAGP